MLKEIQIAEQKDLREQYIGRTEVLEKVKELMLIPEMECMTIRQVAEYYEVDTHTLQMCYERNKNEVDLDGVVSKTPVDFKEILKVTSCAFKNLEQKNGKLIVQIDDKTTLEIPNRGIRVFSKRAILRMGMLLRNSDVAKEVRTQLLNTVEVTTDEQKTKAIDEEQKLLNAIGRAYATGDNLEILNATSALNQFKNRYITQLENSNKTLIKDNGNLKAEKKILVGDILKWTDRKSANKIVRTFAGLIHCDFGVAWKLIYDELLYKHGISLKSRGNKPWIKHIKDKEWKYFYMSVSALCENYGIRTSELFSKAKIDITGLTA